MQDQSYVLIPLRRRDGTIRAHAMIDVEDRELAALPWHLSDRGYVRRNHDGTPKVIYLHRAIMGLESGDRREVDHRDRNRLDCRRANLRIVTHAMNAQNMSPHKGSTSSHRGVSWDARNRRWTSKVHVDGRSYFLGRFAHELEAATVARAFRLAHMPGALD